MDGEGRFFRIEDHSASVSFNLQGYIILEVDSLQQLFKNPRMTTYTHLSSAYPSLDSVYQAAECYTEGITNKQKFLEIIHNPVFAKANSLSVENQRYLKEFILRSKHRPPTVVQQLYMNGYSRIADLIDFSDRRPELERTCHLFWEFVNQAHKIL